MREMPCIITRDDEIDITSRQVDALHRLRENGNVEFYKQSGATLRMFKRMRKRGYVEGPPFAITEKGRMMVARFYD